MLLVSQNIVIRAALMSSPACDDNTAADACLGASAIDSYRDSKCIGSDGQISELMT